jgi:hypothetical protein
MEYTVKARKRQGTKSLDLTIPTDIVKEEVISPGDIFKVKLTKDKNSLTLEYSCIYKKNK